MIELFNFWLRVSPAADVEINALYDDGVSANSFPLINTLSTQTNRLFKRGRDYLDLPGGDTIYNLYSALPEDIYAMVPVREDFQGLEDRYPADIECVGAWNWDGSPIGGHGSPWFPSPTDVKDLGNVILRAGQAPRQFV